MGIQSVLIGAVLLAVVIVAFVFRSARRKLSQGHGEQLKRQWKHVETLTDPSRSVLEAEKVLDHALKFLGYEGSFGEKLKAAERVLPNCQSLWDAHKLRNRIAHEPGFSISHKEAQYAVSQFHKAIKSLS